MNSLTKIIVALALVGLWGCGSGGGKTGSETHWLSCDTADDCNEGFVCSAGRCLPDDEVGQTNNQTTSNRTNNGVNNTTNMTSSNNATSNNATNNVTVNNTTGSNNQTNLCPLTAEPIPVAVDAVHDVTFELTNNYATDIWLGDEGWFCTPWAIDGVQRSLGFRCGCECPNPGPPGVMTFRRLAVGETLNVTWDGRGLATYSECVECTEWDTAPIYEQTGVPQPVNEGTYTFRMPIVLDQPPFDCVNNLDGTATCDPAAGDPGGELPGEIAALCEVGNGAVVEVTQAFDLPASGPLTVPVSLP